MEEKLEHEEPTTAPYEPTAAKEAETARDIDTPRKKYTPWYDAPTPKKPRCLDAWETRM